MSENALVEVYKASSGAQAHVLKSALEAEGIRAFVQGELLQSAAGEVPLGWSSAPRIMVESGDAERARAIIARSDPSITSRETADRVDEDVCLRCGAPLGQNENRCAACGWSYADSEAG